MEKQKPRVKEVPLNLVNSYGPVTKIDFEDYTELVPAFLTIVLMSFTFNIGVGMTAGLLSYPLLKILSGRIREVAPGMWVLAGMSLCFYLFYPCQPGP